MSIPTFQQAVTALVSLRPHPRLLRHSCAVGDVAAWLAEAIAANGQPLNPALVATAAFLHDIDKAIPADDPAKRHPHGEGSAAWLVGRGWPELAALVTDHPVTRLAEDDAWARLQAAPLAARVVAYADKRAGQRLETMDDRFASWRRRYPAGPGEAGRGEGWDHATSTLIRARADALEREVCTAAGIDPTEVRRRKGARPIVRELA